MNDAPVTNVHIAEVLARAAEAEEGHRRRALERAARAAMFVWVDEAADVAEWPGRSLTDLTGVGPWMARNIESILADPPELEDLPEIRRGFLSLAEARAAMSSAPEFVAAVGGDLQMHTLESDGKSTLEEMVAGCLARGYRLNAITDHSVGLKIARGMSEERLLVQAEEIRRFRTELANWPAAADTDVGTAAEGYTLLHGIEMNLAPDGAGDMDPEALAKLDIVLGAFHSALRLEEDQTERYVAGVRNPTIDVLAHPTTRRFGGRLGLRAEWPTVFAAAAEAGHAIEIDGTPARQDLPIELIRVALESDVLFSLGSDAHHVNELHFFDYAVGAAILAGVPAERIVSTRPVEDLLAWAGSNG
jgi:putative hydrolase